MLYNQKIRGTPGINVKTKFGIVYANWVTLKSVMLYILTALNNSSYM